MTSRIEQLKQFINDDPSDVFARYALALEYLKIDSADALRQFELLIERDPNYLPSYFPAAHLMIELGKDLDADKLLTEESNLPNSRETGRWKWSCSRRIWCGSLRGLTNSW